MSAFCIELVLTTLCFLQRSDSILHRRLHPWFINLDIQDVTSQVACLSFFAALSELLWLTVPKSSCLEMSLSTFQ